MDTQSLALPHSSGLVRAALKILLAGQKYMAQQISVCDGINELGVEFYNQDSGNMSVVGKSVVTDYSIGDIENFFSSRAFLWPNIKQSGFNANSMRDKTILLAPISGMRVQFRISSNAPSHDAQKSFRLHHINYESIPSLLEILTLTTATHDKLNLIHSKKSGIVLCSKSQLEGNVDARSIVLALRPDAVFFPEVVSLDATKAIAKLSQDSLVVCGLPACDPLELIVHFVQLLKDARCQDAVKNIIFSFTHERTKRVCAKCAKPAQTTPTTLMALPEALRPLPGSSYMFGRGCEACQHTSYCGTIGLDSIVTLSPTLMSLIDAQESIDNLAFCAYREGTRTPLEDGLSKVRQGIASYESILSVANRITPAFEKAINQFRSDGENSIATIVSPSEFSDSSAANKVVTKGIVSDRPVVLIVEDDDDQRIVLKSLFRTEGYEVVLAEHGEQALQVLVDTAVDIIVCDLMMPKMNGAELVKNMRNSVSLKTIPVLMLTAVDNPEAEYALLDAGADSYCPKTVKKKVLLKRVERLLSRTKS